MFRKWLYEKLSELYPDSGFQVLVPPDPAMGDYSTNISMVAQKNPQEICDQLVAAGKDMINRCEVAGPGFVNIFLKDEYLRRQLGKLEIPNIGGGKKVIVEYSSPNIAKPMHIGHLRGTIIGDALANVYQALGYDVIRWNYIGDWGTQFGKLIVAFKKWSSPEQLERIGVGEMAKLYVQFHVQAAHNPELETQAQQEFARLEAGDSDNRKVWMLFRNASLTEFKRIYSLLRTEFTLYKGESDYETALKPLIDDLVHRGIAKESEGALIIELPNLPPALLRKSDGATLYLTRDLASLKDRIQHYQPLDRVLYVVANQQALHFEQLIAAATKLDWLKTDIIRHVKFGMVLGEDGKKLATREGNAVLLQEVIDKIIALAAERNPDTAQAIGIGALKYNDLRQHPYSDIVFDWKAMLDLGGNSGPYLQYTYARIRGIRAKAGWWARVFARSDTDQLNDPVERSLMRHLLDFGYAVSQSADTYALNGLALYLYELAELANRYYEQVRINDDDNASRKAARLKLLDAVGGTLKKGLELLGIQVLERV